MNKIQQDVEQYIRHLQSSLDKRKAEIWLEAYTVDIYKSVATHHYERKNEKGYRHAMNLKNERNEILQQLHKEQATETRMLKFFENARSFAIALENTK
jgi:hypothetical protein